MSKHSNPISSLPNQSSSDRKLDNEQRRSFLGGALRTVSALPLLAKSLPSFANGKNSAGGHYDFIVLGAGSAGCVVTRRLIDAGHRVLLLEAGPKDTSPAIHIPSEVGTLYGSNVDWAFTTAPQTSADGQSIFWPRGKVEGGSSAINGMIWCRGQPQDYDAWAQGGATDWGYRNIEPYFRKIEHFNLPDPQSVHGHHGLMQIGRPQFTPLTRDFVQAAIEAGFDFRRDYNDGTDSTGISESQMTMFPNNMRASAWTCYVEPVMNHPNLTVIVNALIDRIEIAHGHAQGVRFMHRGETLTARADREVLCACGSIMSPAVLMRSGIGPAKDLAALGIKTVADLPGVGENLHDHATSPMLWSTSLANTPSVTTGQEANIFMRSLPELDACDVQFLLSTNTFPIPGFPTVTQGFVGLPSCLTVRSRGRVSLVSADPAIYPLIDPRVYSHPHDIDVVVRASKAVRNVIGQASLSSWGITEVAPGNSVQTDAEWLAFARKAANTGYHQVGTCKMGVDDMAVVDPELKVRGVTGLRVVDASVMPQATRGNTNAPTLMIAEKAADMILGRSREERGQSHDERGHAHA
ncbi:GMC family oxidoreductase N-terminal domain-containing protein [Paraburkholderia sp. SARCC-3016]|nr:GMC family oxidoreductase N-terminal domain-containing protein [Paraburkholderia sp. SARCC-3016]